MNLPGRFPRIAVVRFLGVGLSALLLALSLRGSLGEPPQDGWVESAGPVPALSTVWVDLDRSPERVSPERTEQAVEPIEPVPSGCSRDRSPDSPSPVEGFGGVSFSPSHPSSTVDLSARQEYELREILERYTLEVEEIESQSRFRSRFEVLAAREEARERKRQRIAGALSVEQRRRWVWLGPELSP